MVPISLGILAHRCSHQVQSWTVTGKSLVDHRTAKHLLNGLNSPGTRRCGINYVLFLNSYIQPFFIYIQNIITKHYIKSTSWKKYILHFLSNKTFLFAFYYKLIVLCYSISIIFTCSTKHIFTSPLSKLTVSLMMNDNNWLSNDSVTDVRRQHATVNWQCWWWRMTACDCQPTVLLMVGDCQPTVLLMVGDSTDRVTDGGWLSTDSVTDGGWLSTDSVTDSGWLSTDSVTDGGWLSTDRVTDGEWLSTDSVTVGGWWVTVNWQCDWWWVSVNWQCYWWWVSVNWLCYWWWVTVNRQCYWWWWVSTDSVTDGGWVSTGSVTDGGWVSTDCVTDGGWLSTDSVTDDGECQLTVLLMVGECQLTVLLMVGECQLTVLLMVGDCQPTVLPMVGECQLTVLLMAGECQLTVLLMVGECQLTVLLMVGECQLTVLLMVGECQLTVLLMADDSMWFLYWTLSPVIQNLRTALSSPCAPTTCRSLLVSSSDRLPPAFVKRNSTFTLLKAKQTITNRIWEDCRTYNVNIISVLINKYVSFNIADHLKPCKSILAFSFPWERSSLQI